METARAIRALADGSGKKLVAYVDGSACSAAYALACVAHSIVAPPSSTLGSIGVLRARIDASAAIAAGGIAMHLIKSGARKGDGDPALPMGADELAAIQDSVDTLASMFFSHVAQYRGVALDVVQGLQAGVLHGERAVAAGLADQTGNLDDALALARGERVVTAAEPQTGPTMATTMAEALEALHAAAEGDNAEEAAQAKRMLAAMEPEEEKEPEAEETEEPPPKKEEEDDTSAKVIAMRAEASAMRAERASILATRPDLSAEAIACLKDVPVSALASALKAIPRASATPTPPKAEAPVLGQGQGGVTMVTDESAALAAVNARFGIKPTPQGVVREGNTTKYYPIGGPR
jgi:ClpP class serine protease